jgi:hypothetical protein
MAPQSRGVKNSKKKTTKTLQKKKNQFPNTQNIRCLLLRYY